MYNIKFLNENEIKIFKILVISDNIIEVKNIEQNLSGFKVYRENGDLLGDYSDYTTLYRVLEDGYQLSNDGSVYKEPEEIAESEITIEDAKTQKLIELSSLESQYIEQGQDIQMEDGITDHFTYRQDDQANIKNAFDIANALILKGVDMEIPFYDSNKVCKKYPTKDIITIYMSMQTYITYVTTLSHQLQAMIKDSNDKNFIQNLTFDVENLTGKYLETFNDMVNQSKDIVKVLVS